MFANVVSVVALLVAVGATVYARRATRANERVATIEEQRRADELEQRRHADLRVTLKKIDRSDYVVVTNAGGGAASNVSIESLDPSKGVTTVVVPVGGPIGPGETRSLLMTMSLASLVPPPFRIGWTDTSGDHVDDRLLYPAG